jgi:hypothetical protein
MHLAAQGVSILRPRDLVAEGRHFRGLVFNGYAAASLSGQKKIFGRRGNLAIYSFISHPSLAMWRSDLVKRNSRLPNDEQSCAAEGAAAHLYRSSTMSRARFISAQPTTPSPNLRDDVQLLRLIILHDVHRTTRISRHIRNLKSAWE